MIRSALAAIRRARRSPFDPDQARPGAAAGASASTKRANRGLTVQRAVLGLVSSGLFAVAGLLAPGLAGTAVGASSAKVVIVVGPVGDAQTATYISDANAAAAVARTYTSNVVTIYSPHATWGAVSSAMQGANIVLYLGHGNGFPSPYSSTLNRTGMDGMGLNATDNAGNSNWKYYGESYFATYVRLAPNAVVLFSRLCYASGNNEWGAGVPTLDVAKQRVDNYAAGFIASGARAVIADGLGDAGWYISAIFSRSTSMEMIFRAAPDNHNNFHYYWSSRSPGYTMLLDPGTYSYVPDHDPYYRSMVGSLTLATKSVVGTAATSSLSGRTTASAVNLRTGPSTGNAIVTSLPLGAGFSVTGAIRTDSSGRTWAPIRTSAGASGYIASSFATFGGSASATASLNVRSSASTSSAILAVVAQGTRFTVTGSYSDSLARTWFAAKLSTGKMGWVASWYTAP